MRPIIRSLFFIICIMALIGAGWYTFDYILYVTQSVFTTLSYPVLQIQRSIVSPLQHIQTMVQNQKYATDIVQRYDDAYHDLLAENIALQGQLNRAEEFAELHDFAKRYNTQYLVPTQVLLRNITKKEHYILVEGGKNRSITTDMIAVYKNCIFGRVVEVFPYMSKVILITDNRCKIAATCTKTGATGVCQGTNASDRLELTYVSHLDAVMPEDYVLSRGKEIVFPAGFGLGIVKSHHCEGLLHEIMLTPLVDVMHISSCYLMRPGVEHEQ